jgi:hypothetical protein
MLYDCGQPVCFKCSDDIDTERRHGPVGRKPPASVTHLDHLKPETVHSHVG